MTMHGTYNVSLYNFDQVMLNQIMHKMSTTIAHPTINNFASTIQHFIIHVYVYALDSIVKNINICFNRGLNNSKY